MEQSSASRRARRITLAVATCTLAILIVLAMPQLAHAAQAKNSPMKRASFTTTNTISFTKYDVTGDHKPDKVKIVLGNRNESMFESLHVYANGVLQFTYWEGFDKVDAKIMTMKNGRSFLCLDTVSEWCGYSALMLTWKKGKLRKVCELNDTTKKIRGNHRFIHAIKAKGNRIYVLQSIMSSYAGGIEAQFVYKYKGGKLVRASKTGQWAKYMAMKASPKVVHINRGVPVYKSPTSKTKIFRTVKGQALKATKVYVSGRTLAVKAKSGSKVGWIKIPNKRGSSTPLFRETFFAG